jgi:hypothetical protein
LLSHPSQRLEKGTELGSSQHEKSMFFLQADIEIMTASAKKGLLSAQAHEGR